MSMRPIQLSHAGKGGEDLGKGRSASDENESLSHHSDDSKAWGMEAVAKPVGYNVKEDFKVAPTGRIQYPRANLPIPFANHDELGTGIEFVVKMTHNILNKITPDNFYEMVAKLTKLPFEDEDEHISKTTVVARMIYEKAMTMSDESSFLVLYAKLVHEFCKTSLEFSKKVRKCILDTCQLEFQNSIGVGKKDATFGCAYARMVRMFCVTSPETSNKIRKKILDQCPKEFQKSNTNEAEIKDVEQKLEEATDDETRKRLKLELEDKTFMSRRRSNVNVIFIGELYKLQMLTPKIIVQCVYLLLYSPDQENLECLCKLLTTVGQKLDLQLRTLEEQAQRGGKPRFIPEMDKCMDKIFAKLKTLSENKELSSRIRFAILDVAELRKNEWQSPSNNSIKREAVEEKKFQETEQSQHPVYYAPTVAGGTPGQYIQISPYQINSTVNPGIPLHQLTQIHAYTPRYGQVFTTGNGQQTYSHPHPFYQAAAAAPTQPVKHKVYHQQHRMGTAAIHTSSQSVANAQKLQQAPTTNSTPQTGPASNKGASTTESIQIPLPSSIEKQDLQNQNIQQTQDSQDAKLKDEPAAGSVNEEPGTSATERNKRKAKFYQKIAHASDDANTSKIEEGKQRDGDEEPNVANSSAKEKIKYDRDTLLMIGNQHNYNDFNVADRGLPDLAKDTANNHHIKSHGPLMNTNTSIRVYRAVDGSSFGLPGSQQQKKGDWTKVSKASRFQSVKKTKPVGSGTPIFGIPSFGGGGQWGQTAQSGPPSGPSQQSSIPPREIPPRFPNLPSNRLQNLPVDDSSRSSNKGNQNSVPSEPQGFRSKQIPPMFQTQQQQHAPPLLPATSPPMSSNSLAANTRPVSQIDNSETFTADTSESVKNIFQEYLSCHKFDDTLHWIKSRFPGDKIDEFVEEMSRQVSKMPKEVEQKCAGMLLRLLIRNKEIPKKTVIKLMAQGVMEDLPDIMINVPKATTHLAQFLIEIFYEESNLNWLVKVGDRLIQNKDCGESAWNELAVSSLNLLKLRHNEEVVRTSFRKTKRRVVIPLDELSWLQYKTLDSLIDHMVKVLSPKLNPDTSEEIEQIFKEYSWDVRDEATIRALTEAICILTWNPETASWRDESVKKLLPLLSLPNQRMFPIVWKQVEDYLKKMSIDKRKGEGLWNIMFSLNMTTTGSE